MHFMQRSMPLRQKIDFGVLFFVIVAGAFAINNAFTIGDWWHSLWYTPPPGMVALADGSGMNGKGKEYFYRFSPQYITAKSMEKKCGGIKLGCVEGSSIYILVSDNSRAEFDRSVVTAAHEMLHVAYSRLSSSERQQLDNHLAIVLRKRSAMDIREILASYPRADYFNEADSYVGTQMKDVGVWLNDYYSHYFSNRNKVVEAFFHSPEAVLVRD